MKSKIFSLRARTKSIKYAWEGLLAFFDEQHNAIIHLWATLLVMLMAVFFNCSLYEKIALVLAIGFVWSAEVFNTAIEKLADHLAPEKHPNIKFVKDVAAAAVLIAAVTAIIVGAFIFIPRFL